MNSSYKNSLSFNRNLEKINQDYHEVYQRPIPIDSINKYWGVDAVFSKHDETLQKQSFDQSNKNFWSFVEYNLPGYPEMNNMNSMGQSGLGLSQSMSNNTRSLQGSGSSGFSGSRMGMGNPSNKITGLNYQEAKIKSMK